MYRSLFIIQVIVFLLLGACVDTFDDVKPEIELIKSKWVPDARVDIFNVESEVSNIVILKGETSIKEAKEELLQLLANQQYTFVDSILVLPAVDLIDKWAVTTISVANLRDMPKHSAQLVSQTIMGTPLRVLKKGEGWSLVQCPDRYIAWTNNSSLQFMDDDEFKSWRGSQRKVIIKDCWLTDKNGIRVSDLVVGSIVGFSGMNKSEVTLVLPDGRSGNTNLSCANEFKSFCNDSTLFADKLVFISKSFLGLPYLWGGTSSKAVDCSGFMKNIYFMNGFVLARDASQQINVGQSVELVIDSLRAGDLLFFGDKETNRVTHVGMYIGDTEFIHSSGRVKINSLDQSRENFSGYRSNSWLGTQRYIGQKHSEGLMPIATHPWYVLNN